MGHRTGLTPRSSLLQLRPSPFHQPRVSKVGLPSHTQLPPPMATAPDPGFSRQSPQNPQPRLSSVHGVLVPEPRKNILQKQEHLNFLPIDPNYTPLKPPRGSPLVQGQLPILPPGELALG